MYLARKAEILCRRFTGPVYARIHVQPSKKATFICKKASVIA